MKNFHWKIFIEDMESNLYEEQKHLEIDKKTENSYDLVPTNCKYHKRTMG